MLYRNYAKMDFAFYLEGDYYGNDEKNKDF